MRERRGFSEVLVKFNEHQIQDLKILQSNLEAAVDIVLRDSLGSKIMLSDRARILLLQLVRERLSDAQ